MPSETFGPDELSELEEAIADACAEKRRAGWSICQHVTYAPERMCCCPLGALTNTSEPRRFPGFTDGFDGRDRDITARHLPSGCKTLQFFDMGARFRERLETGEL